MVVVGIILLFALTSGICADIPDENVALGKVAKQISTLSGYPADRALVASYTQGSLTGFHPEAWWQVDLRGYYTLHTIYITATSISSWTQFMKGAWVEATDKDVDLCPDAQRVWCGNISDTVAVTEVFTISCEADFPVRFIRVFNKDHRIGLGFVDVRATEAMKRYRSYLTATDDKRVTQVHRSTSAFMAGDCGVQCHKDHECLNFSFNPTAPFEENCLLTYSQVPQNTANAPGWRTFKHNECV